MKIIRRIPKRLPSTPALIGEGAGAYAIWTGRSWFGSVSRTFGRSWQPQHWMLTTHGSPCEVFKSFEGARSEAEARAIRAEGG